MQLAISSSGLINAAGKERHLENHGLGLRPSGSLSSVLLRQPMDQAWCKQNPGQILAIWFPLVDRSSLNKKSVEIFQKKKQTYTPVSLWEMEDNLSLVFQISNC